MDLEERHGGGGGRCEGIGICGGIGTRGSIVDGGGIGSLVGIVVEEGKKSERWSACVELVSPE